MEFNYNYKLPLQQHLEQSVTELTVAWSLDKLTHQKTITITNVTLNSLHYFRIRGIKPGRRTTFWFRIDYTLI